MPGVDTNLPFKGAGKEAPDDCGTLDTGGTVQIMFKPSDSGPALYPCKASGGGMGVCPSSLHVFYRLGEGLPMCPSGLVGGYPCYRHIVHRTTRLG